MSRYGIRAGSYGERLIDAYFPDWPTREPKPRVVVGCFPDPKDPYRQTRHRKWVFVKGVHSTPEHPYWEEQCTRCKEYRSEVYG